MSTEEDSPIVRMKKGEIATWTARVEMAKRLGDSQLMQKALKYKTKYEKELADLLKLLADSEERDRLQMLNRYQPEAEGCLWCSMFSSLPDFQFPEDDFAALAGSSEFMREIVAAMERWKNAELQDLDTAITACLNPSWTCEDCRIKWNKIIGSLELLKAAAQTEP